MNEVDGHGLSAVNLNLLPALNALMQERQVSAAARRMSVTQSAMSHALAKLRHLLDDPLLVQSAGGMIATPRGERISAELPMALKALSEVIATPAPFDPLASTRAFTLATLDYFEITTLPQVLECLSQEAPKVALNVERADSDTAERLRAGAIDLLLLGTSAKMNSAGLERRDLYEEPFAVIARDGHPLFKRRVTLKRYLQAEHVLVSHERSTNGVVDRVLRGCGMERRVALRVPHFLSAPLVVARSDLICTVALSVAERARELFGVRVFQPPIELPRAGIAAWWPRQHNADPARVWFRDLMLSGRAFAPSLQRWLAPT